MRDRALFRIDKQVFFEEGFNTWLVEWRALECVGKKSIFLNSLELQAKDMKSIPIILEASKTRTLVATEREKLERVVKMVQLMLFIQTQESSKDASMPPSFQCLSNTRSPNISLVIQAEIYLRTKFKSNDKKKFDSDIARAKSFIDSIIRTQSHEIYL